MTKHFENNLKFYPQIPKGPSVDFTHGRLKVSENGRYLQHQDGTPFFYMGDTAWELFHRADLEQADMYLENRRRKGFTVVQAVILAELDGLNTPNVYGEKPLVDNNPETPNEAYFEFVDSIVDRALEKGICIGLLPTWGDKVYAREKIGVGPVVFTPQNARSFGRFLGTRYSRKPNIIWILGGDRPPLECEAIWREMAAGLKEGDGSNHLITYHPMGGQTSSAWFHNEDWLDFNLLQSGHGGPDYPNYTMVEADYALQPVKPCIDGEPRYEGIPVAFRYENGRQTDYDTRQAAYWAVFAGAHGHTYGCNDIWQMYGPGKEPFVWADTYWYDALDFPGAWQMLCLRRLIESRPYFERIPDQALVLKGQGEGADHVQATRATDGSYLFAYLPSGKAVTMDTGKLSGSRIRAYWYNPREGRASLLGEYDNTGAMEFVPPLAGRGNDWVLVLDDADRDFPEPGACGPTV